MATVTEERIINKLAGHFRNVDGITAAFDFAENPDQLSKPMLPAVMLYPQNVPMEPAAHKNVWSNQFNIIALVFVIPRDARAGKLKYLENDAIRLMPQIRKQFQTQSVVEDLLSLGVVRGWITNVRYGAGGRLLTHMGVEYVGLITEFNFREVN